MKKIIALALAAVMSLSMVACGNNADEPKEPEVTPLTIVEVLDKVLEEAPMPTEMVKTELDLTDADSVLYFTGVADPAKFEKVAVAEPMIGAIPVSFVVAKAAEGVDIEALRAEMAAGIDMAKWVCVNADTALTMAWEDGTVVFAMMAASEDMNIETYKTAFTTVKGEAVYAETIDATETEIVDDTEAPIDEPAAEAGIETEAEFIEEETVVVEDEAVEDAE